MQQDKKYKRIGWITSVLTQVVMLILFYFLIAWKEPFPPIPSYGIELSFGFTETGQGAEPVTTTDPVEESEEVSEPIEASEVEPVEESEPLETNESEVTPDEIEPATEEPSPDEVLNEKAVEETSEPEKIEEPKELVEESKSTDAVKDAPIDKTNNDTQGTTDEKGDEGKEDAVLDDRAIYGNQGAGEGASLQMAGWTWDSRPKPNDQSSETGKITYKIKIDDEGYIIDIDLVSSTVTPAVERLYRQSVERLSFSKTSNYAPAPTSSGTITFIIQAK